MVKIFYSYCHQDESDRNELEKWLTVLKREGLIDEWHDRKIGAGKHIHNTIEENMETSNIILLLFSQDYIASDSCFDEIKKSIYLHRKNGTIFIPIMLKPCTWENISVEIDSKNYKLSDYLAIPKDAKPISTWTDKNDAWKNIYMYLVDTLNEIKKNQNITLSQDFINSKLNYNPIFGAINLKEMFVYPMLEKREYSEDRVEVDGFILKTLGLDSEKDYFALIEGEEQSGKTSLCHMLMIQYYEEGKYPILLNGVTIVGKAHYEEYIQQLFSEQYIGPFVAYCNLPKSKKILLIDDIEKRKANDANFDKFMTDIVSYFGVIIITVDKLENLIISTTKINCFSLFNQYSILEFGYKKKDHLIKKFISNHIGQEFSDENNEHLLNLDLYTTHVNSIIDIGSVKSYPFFVLTILQALVITKPADYSKTSYGHCYHAMITTHLVRANVAPEDVDTCFKFLAELAYYMFHNKILRLSYEQYIKFESQYTDTYLIESPDYILNKLINAHIISQEKDQYGFVQIYVYYFFVGKYFSENFNNEHCIQKEVEDLLTRIDKKDNANILIFLIYHTKDERLLEQIKTHAICTFDGYAEATLAGEESKFIEQISNDIAMQVIEDRSHATIRNEILDYKDNLSNKKIKKSSEENLTNKSIINEDNLYIEIKKASRSIEIIGQILRNQFGSLKIFQIKELYEQGQNVGLRLLKSFMMVIKEEKGNLELYIEKMLEKIAKNKGAEMSAEDISKLSKNIAASFSYNVIFYWIGKITESLGYNKLLIPIDAVNKKINTPVTKLINFAIYLWHKKDLNFKKVQELYNEFRLEANYQAIHILRDIVILHSYMHPVHIGTKQKIEKLLRISVKSQQQIALQRESSKVKLLKTN